MKTDYSKLDAAILAAIGKRSPLGFTRLCSGAIEREANRLSAQARGKSAGPSDDVPAWRFVDRRLQALRKAGRIRYQRKPEGWVLGAAPAKADKVPA